MHLKTLTLRGFKSFASATTLRFEPGVTCVVGPNGSGKSNVVDALAWVMGEQGAKTLRGGKMEDVIFAGTAGRPPLGRAEVSLTIDNSDGALPIEYSEVTITRTLFRNGGSEYAINGSSCRLLDIQDLLSDSGLGREMHVIVGQGQLDAVLRATPEERRGFIEEAAGVLKHRKRKEKALRKLEGMQGNLLRLGDLTAEVRRQLGPLGRQAEAARRAAVVQADLRDARARLLADDLAQLVAALEQEIAEDTAIKQRQAAAEQALERARADLAASETRAAAAAPALAAAAETWYELSALAERVRGTQTLAAERLRLLSSPREAPRGQDPRDLEAQAERARATEAGLLREVDEHRGALEAAVAARAGAEQRAGEAERALADLVRAAADRREGQARLAGRVAAARSRHEATAAEIERLRESLAEAQRRSARAAEEAEALEAQVHGAEEGEHDLDAQHEAAAEALDAASQTLRAVRAERAEAEAEQSRWRTRSETLEMSLARKDGAGVLLASDLDGLLGPVAGLLTITPGYEDAVAAALGSHADGVAVGSADAAAAALLLLRDEEAGRATLVVGAGPGADRETGTDAADLPAGVVRASDVVEVDPALRAGVAALLAGVVVVPDLDGARELLAGRPDLIAVTRAGDLLGAHRARGGSASAPGVLHLQAALEEARAGLRDVEERLLAVDAAESAAREARSVAQARSDETLLALNESDAALAAVAERLGRLGATARGAAAEAERFARQLETASATLDRLGEEVSELEDRLEAARALPAESEESVTAATAERDDLAAAAARARSQETEARLALRTSEERAKALSGRAQSLDRAAAAERAARERAAALEQQRLRQVEQAAAVQDGAATLLRQVESSLATAARERDTAQRARTEHDEETARRRSAVHELEARLRELTDVAHRDEVLRAQHQLRIEQVEQRSRDELGLDPEVLVEEYGPHRPVPAAPAAARDDEEEGEADPGRPYVRAEQEKRLATAERAIARLGRVNPLALEEFAALEERHAFLTEQLADLKTSRADLMQIVREIDERVEQVFTDAFRDTEEQFRDVFPRLFPGGEGRLVLTDPSDMLTTGIEVEARPAGKRVKRLSLLSGGERSLTAVALLVSIFKARPSPFYVMDEVEAALDDTNLGRLLEIFVELQRDSQLIVITHQKRTMEIADALYGVTMQGDGVTTVISQRMPARG